ncbi:MAG TPA: hypothetical protein IGS37_09415 [Synechococcales cyanobacterium M55_K2018_004]|nr:hypothetical protein [Synechococcales cyanobacterium M55_K2018_004]
MEVHYPNKKDLTAEEQRQLQHMKEVIERAIADGVLTSQELDRIYGVLQTDRHLTPQEMELIETLVRDKVDQGELVFEQSWDS